MLQEDASSARRETVTRRHLGASKAPTDSQQGKIIIIIVVVVVVVVVVIIIIIIISDSETEKAALLEAGEKGRRSKEASRRYLSRRDLGLNK